MRAHPLSPLNQLYRNLSFVVSANSCEWIVLDRSLDLDRLREAAIALVRAHPVLNSVQTKRGLLYYWEELDGPITVDIRHKKVPAMTPDELHRRLVDNIHREPLPLVRERPWRIHVTESPGGRTWLQIITTHVFSDGRSANIVARDLAAAYSAAVSGRVWHPAPVGEVRDPMALFTPHLPEKEKKRLRRAAVKAVIKDAVTPCVGLKVDRVPRGETAVQFFDYGATVWNRLKAGSRRVDMSVHPFILAGVLRTIEQLNRDRGVRSPRIRIVDNFSLRRFAKQRETIDDLYDALATPYTVDFTLTEDNTALVNQIRRKLDALKQGEILRELYRAQLYLQAGLLSHKKSATQLVTRFVVKSNVVCTNIGPVPEDFDAFGDSRVEDYYSFSQMFPPGELMFLFSTYRGRLRVVLLHDDRRIPAARVREIGETLFPANLFQALEDCESAACASLPRRFDSIARAKNESDNVTGGVS